MQQKGVEVKTSNQHGVYLKAGEGRPLRVFGEVVTRKVASERTGGAYSLFEAVAQPRGSVPPHIHHREDECFYILESEFEFMIEGQSVRTSTGSLIYIPKGTLHSYENITESLGRMLVSQTPGGSYEHFCEEIGEEATSEVEPEFEGNSPEAARIAKIAAHYGIEIVLPKTLERSAQ